MFQEASDGPDDADNNPPPSAGEIMPRSPTEDMQEVSDILKRLDFTEVPSLILTQITLKKIDKDTKLMLWITISNDIDHGIIIRFDFQGDNKEVKLVIGALGSKFHLVPITTRGKFSGWYSVQKL